MSQALGDRSDGRTGGDPGSAVGTPARADSAAHGISLEPLGRPGTSRTYALDPDAWLDLAPRGMTRRLVAAGVLRYAGRRVLISLERPAFWDDAEVVGAVAAAFARTRQHERST